MQKQNKNKFILFWKKYIVRETNKWTWILMIFWTLFFLVLYLLIFFTAKKGWIDTQSSVAILILAVVGLATVIRLGLFNIYTRGFKNFQIERENKILKENNMPQKEKINMQDMIKEKKKKSLIPYLYGIISAILLLITSLPFI